MYTSSHLPTLLSVSTENSVSQTYSSSVVPGPRYILGLRVSRLLVRPPFGNTWFLGLRRLRCFLCLTCCTSSQGKLLNQPSCTFAGPASPTQLFWCCCVLLMATADSTCPLKTLHCQEDGRVYISIFVEDTKLSVRINASQQRHPR